MAKLSPLTILLSMAALPAHAETRSADSHVHGTGTLMIAVEGEHVAIGFEAPGADITGFEHAAESDADKAAIAAAEKQLADPLALFVLPEAAGCEVEHVMAALSDGEEEHEEHGHDDHEDHGDHDDHADHDDHGHDEHAGEDDHDDHGHDASEAEHSEFHAEYALHCDTPSALTEIRFDYFETFPNAEKLQVQIIDGAGARGFDVERGSRVLKTGGIN